MDISAGPGKHDQSFNALQTLQKWFILIKLQETIVYKYIYALIFFQFLSF